MNYYKISTKQCSTKYWERTYNNTVYVESVLIHYSRNSLMWTNFKLLCINLLVVFIIVTIWSHSLWWRMNISNIYQYIKYANDSILIWQWQILITNIPIRLCTLMLKLTVLCWGKTLDNICNCVIIYALKQFVVKN